MDNNEIYTAIDSEVIMSDILKEFKRLDFQKTANLGKRERIQRKHYIVHTVCEVDRIMQRAGWQFKRFNGQSFVYNGACWKALSDEQLLNFFGKVAERLGVPFEDARYYQFRRDLMLQFESVGILAPPQRDQETTRINLLNGTFEFRHDKYWIRKPDPEDFITYQLAFCFDINAKAPRFMEFLNRVLPDIERQMILQEYIAYLFVSSKRLKLEKVLLLFGSGANGKSVFIDVISAMLGEENVSRYSLESITNVSGYSRAELATKIANICSELSARFVLEIAKQIISGEPVEARRIYGRPFTMDAYAKLIFSTNELPRDVEHSNGFFRRWLIVPFDQTIPEHEQDKELSKKIIESELSGVFNWVLQGLERLLSQKRFSECQAVDKQIRDYRKQSDSVALFMDEEGLKPSTNSQIPLKEVYFRYKCFCIENEYRPCSNSTFSERLRKLSFEVKRLSLGNVVYCNYLNNNNLKIA